MVVFWAYISFGQLLIYWIGDIPDEVSYFVRRTAGTWTAVTYVIVFGHFVVPFFVLLNRRLKRHPVVLAGGRRLGLRDALRRRVLAGVARPRRRPARDRTGSTSARALFVGGLSCAWIVRRYATAAPLPLHVPELAEGLDYEAAV